MTRQDSKSRSAKPYYFYRSLTSVYILSSFKSIILELTEQRHGRQVVSKQYLQKKITATGQLAWRLKKPLSVRKVWGSISGPVKSDPSTPTARHRHNYSLEFEVVLPRH